MAAVDLSKVYWIKHASTDRYLTVSGNEVALSPLNTGDLPQRWRFKDAQAGSKYLIENVSNARQISARSFRDDMEVELKSPEGDKWSVYLITRDSSQQAIVSIELSPSTYTPVFLQPGRSGKAITSPKSSAEQWVLIPVDSKPPGPIPPGPIPPGPTPPRPHPLPKGNYRIRSFDSKLLLTMDSGPEGTVYVTRQGGPSSDLLRQQEWALTPNAQTNLYQIQNVATNRWLAVASSNPESDVTSQKETMEKWSIETLVQGVLYSIKLDKLSVAFRDFNADDYDQLALKESQNIPSQIWFFEKADGITHDKFLAKRHLEPGRYTIRSCHNAQFMKTKYGVKPETLELNGMDITNTLYTFILKYKDDKSPIFTLQHEESKHYLESTGGSHIQLRQYSDSSVREWVLIRQMIGKSEPPYCIALAADRFQAISCRLGEGDHFALDEMKPGESMQMWNLRPA